MAGSRRNVNISISFKQADFKLPPLDFSALTKSLDALDKRLDESSKKQSDLLLSAAKGAKLAGEGLFTMARGSARLFATNEEELEKVTEAIEQFQGAFDVFKGGTDLVIGIAQAMKAYRTAAAAGAVANTGLASSNTAVAVTGTTAAAAMTALELAINPVGLSVIAIGVSVVALGVLFTESGRKSRAASQKILDDLSKQLTLQERITKETRSRVDIELKLSGNRSQLSDILISRLKLKDQIVALDKRIAANEPGGLTAGFVKNIKRQKLIWESEAEIKTLKKSIAEREQFRGALPGGPAVASGAATALEHKRDELEAEQGKLAQLKIDAGKNESIQLQDNIALNQKVIAQGDMQIKAAQQAEQIEKRQLEVQLKTLETKRQQLKETKAIFKEENARIRSAEVTIGSLSKGELRRLERIANKRDVGEELTRRDRGFLRSTVGGIAEFRNLLDDEDSAIGRDRDTAGLTRRITGRELTTRKDESVAVLDKKFDTTEEIDAKQIELEGKMKDVEKTRGAQLDNLIEFQDRALIIAASQEGRVAEIGRKVESLESKFGEITDGANQ